MFKPDIKPTWEDPANSHGGKLVIRIREPAPEPASRLWMLLLRAAWANNLHSEEDVCGLVFSLRPKGHMISIWTRASEEVKLEAMTKFYRQVLGLTRSTIQYQWHKESEQRNSMVSRGSEAHGRKSTDGGRASAWRQSKSGRRPSGAESEMHRRLSEAAAEGGEGGPGEAFGPGGEAAQDPDGGGWVMVDKTKGKKATRCFPYPRDSSLTVALIPLPCD